MQPRAGNSAKTAIVASLLAALCAAFPARGFAQTIEEFDVPAPSSTPQFITLGPDGNLWFTEAGADRIGRITPGGTIVEFGLPSAGSEPWGITAGPDGALWFTELFGNRIGRISVEGQISEFTIPTPKSLPFGIVTGPDGALWFTERETNKIGRVSVTGQITEFPLAPYVGPAGIALGGDGALWFAEQYGQRAGRLTTGGAWTEVTIPASGYPFGIAAASDGSLWLTTIPSSGSAVKIPPTGPLVVRVLTPYSTGDPAIDASGNLWYTESDGKIGRLDTHGQITTFTIPTSGADPMGIAVDSGGKIWFTESQTNKIGRLDPASGGATCSAPAAPVLTVDGQSSVSLSSGDRFTLAWTSTLGGSTGSYDVLRSDSNVLPFSSAATTSSTFLALTASAGDAGKTIRFEVQAIRECASTHATSPASNAVAVNVAAAPPPPPPPTGGCTTGPGGRPCAIIATPPPSAEVVDRQP